MVCFEFHHKVTLTNSVHPDQLLQNVASEVTLNMIYTALNTAISIDIIKHCSDNQ